MKVLLVINSLNVGGAERMLARPVSSKALEKDEVLIAVLASKGALTDELVSSGFNVVHLNAKKSISGFFRLLKLPILYWRFKPDVIHSWLYHSDLIAGLCALIFGRRPTIWSIRQTDISLAHNRVATIICAKICAWLSAILPEVIITNADASRASHIDFGYAEHKIKTIPNGIDLQKFFPDPRAGLQVRRELGLQPGDLIIGMVARLNSQKNHRAFFAAAQTLSGLYPNLYFLLCGEGMDKGNPALKAIIDFDLSPSRFHFLGQRRDVANIMNALDLFMLSSSGEGWPNVVGEAMACGVPCVVTDVGDAAQIVNDTGFVAPPDDPVALANAAHIFFNLPDTERSSLSTAARRRIEELFDITDVAAQYRAVYEEVRLIAKRQG